MAKRSVGKPRFYADYPSFLKTMAYYKGSYVDGFTDAVHLKMQKVFLI